MAEFSKLIVFIIRLFFEASLFYTLAYQAPEVVRVSVVQNLPWEQWHHVQLNPHNYAFNDYDVPK